MVDPQRRLGDSLRGAFGPPGKARVSPLDGVLSGGRTDGTRVGTDREDPEQVVRMSPQQRRAHTQIIGGSGSGKSKLLEYLVRQDIEDPGCGLCLIDPHGKTYDDLVHYLSHSRPELAKRVVLFNPADQSEMVLGFNPLGPQALEYPYAALNAVMTGILKTWGQGNINDTPRIGRWLENIFTVIISNRLTMLETMPLISAARDSSDRQLLMNAINVELVRQDWEEYDQASSQQRHAYIEGPHNRMRKFLRSAFLRSMFGVQERLLDVRRVVDEKQILLVNLAPSDEIDKDDMQMVGILLIHELFRAALRRDPRAEPSPFYLYIDEFAQYVTDDIAYMLDECRKYGLFLTLIHQQLEQLKRESDYLYASVMTNCRNRVVFGSLSYRDAELLSEEIDSGYEDFYAVKYRTEQTKFRPIEELGPTFTRGGSHADGYAAAFLQGISLSTSLGRALARSETESVTESTGESESESLALALTRARMLGQSRGESTSHMDSRSAADATGASLSHNKNTGRSTSQGETTGAGSTESLAFSTGDTAGRSQVANYAFSTPATLSKTHAETEQRGNTATETTNRSRSASESESEGEGRGLSVQHVDGTAAADTKGTQTSKSDSTSEGEGETTTQAQSRQRGHAETTGSGKTETEQLTRALGLQLSLSHSETHSDTESWSVSVGMRHRMEEYKEGQEHYWNLPELRHRLIAELKNQGVAEATFRFGTDKPVKVKVDAVVSPPWYPRISPQRQAVFRSRVYAASPDYYQTPAEALEEICTRQTMRFSRPFDYDWFGRPPIEGSAEILPALPAPDDDDGLFTHR